MINEKAKGKDNTFYLGITNSAVGESWIHSHCDICYRNGNTCTIVNYAMAGIYKGQLIYDENDEPICTKFKHKDEHIVKHRPEKDVMEIEL